MKYRRRPKRRFLPWLIIMLGLGGATYLVMKKPVPVYVEPKSLAPSVTTAHFTYGAYPALYEGTGKVSPAQSIMLHSEVPGTVQQVTPEFLPGHIVKQGDTLLQLKSGNYENKVKQKQAIYDQAIASHLIEKGQQSVAKTGVETIYAATGQRPQDMDLATREPQVAHAEAEIHSAKAALEIAESDLSDTTVRSPFDAMILTRNVDVGSVVTTATPLAHLVGTDQYWIEVSVPVEVLPLFVPRTTPIKAMVSPYHVSDALEGYVLKTVMALDEKTRMGKVIVAVDDPLRIRQVANWKRTNNLAEHPMLLMLNDYVKVSIEGRKIHDVIQLPIDYLRMNNTVWVLCEQKLCIKSVEVVMKNAAYAYIRSGITAEDAIITSAISAPIPHMALTVDGQSE
jgi:multidrug efflux pump subunit AcrA (membrane-fusion protein)